MRPNLQFQLDMEDKGSLLAASSLQKYREAAPKRQGRLTDASRTHVIVAALAVKRHGSPAVGRLRRELARALSVGGQGRAALLLLRDMLSRLEASGVQA